MARLRKLALLSLSVPSLGACADIACGVAHDVFIDNCASDCEQDPVCLELCYQDAEQQLDACVDEARRNRR